MRKELVRSVMKRNHTVRRTDFARRKRLRATDRLLEAIVARTGRRRVNRAGSGCGGKRSDAGLHQRPFVTRGRRRIFNRNPLRGNRYRNVGRLNVKRNGRGR